MHPGGSKAKASAIESSTNGTTSNVTAGLDAHACAVHQKTQIAMYVNELELKVHTFPVPTEARGQGAAANPPVQS